MYKVYKSSKKPAGLFTMSREELDEVLDMLACGSLDPNPPEDDDDYNIGALGRYLRENDKEFSDLTPEEIEMFRIKP